MTVLVTGGAGYIGSHMVHTLLEAGEQAVVLDNLTTGFDWAMPPGATLIVGEPIARGRAHRRAPDRRHYPFRRLDRRTRLGSRSARLLPQQHGQLPRPDRGRGQSGGELFHLLLDCGGLRQSSARAGARGRSHRADLALWVLEADEQIMLRDAGIAHGLRHVILRYFNVAGADPLGRTGQSTRAATHLIKVAVETALGRRPKIEVFGADYPTPDGTGIRDYIHVFDLVAAHSDALACLRRRRRVRDAQLRLRPRLFGAGGDRHRQACRGRRLQGRARTAAGDPTQIMAACDRVRSTLGWQPRFNDLQTIVAHALAWERKLSKRAG
jgi:UDP-glucose 4-epimerase